MMDKICKICGKRITTSVERHFEKKHYSIFIANRQKIEQHPGAFARNINSEARKYTPIPQKISEEKHESTERFDQHKMNRIVTDFEKHLGEQTYRGLKYFRCDGCLKMHKHGKVIYRNISNLHLCYACYRYLKEHTDSNRGNKHVYINTPM